MTQFKGSYAIGLVYEEKPMMMLKNEKALAALEYYGITITEAEDEEMGAYLANVPLHLAKIIDDGGGWKLIVPYEEFYIEITCESA